MVELAARTTEVLGCTGAPEMAGCLRAATADELLEVPGANLTTITNGRADFYTNVDGYVLTENPLQAFRAGRVNPVSVIGGTTRDENLATVQFFYESPPTNDTEYRAAISRLFGPEEEDTLVGMYPPSSYGSHVGALAALLSDLTMHCPLRRVLRGLSEVGAPSVRRYLYSPRTGAAAHSADAALPLGIASTPVEAAISQNIMDYWVSFAASGDPNDGARFDWPAYDPATDNYLVLAEDLEVASGFRSLQCDFWDTDPLGIDPLGD